ncbi:MAG: hypothetical protein M3139_17935 [Bacteroidota bacterium]|nr:hypothetical protein [Bacteroidota bacterium]
MNNDLEINYKQHLSDDKYIDYSIILFCKSEISPWGTNDFIWEGEHKNEKIVVKLPRGTSEYFATIEKSNDLDINPQIFTELKRVLRQLD